VQLTKSQVRKSLSTAIFMMLASAWSYAQNTTDAAAQPDLPMVSEPSIEELNMQGGDAAMPPFAVSNVDVNSSYRRALLSKGIALRLISQEQYAQNLLQAPVPADQQAFVGDTPFGSTLAHLIFTSDLRQLGLHHAQLHMSGVWNWASWEPAGPKAFDFWSLNLYKEFGRDRVEIKVGYNSNELEFVACRWADRRPAACRASMPCCLTNSPSTRACN